MRLRCDDPSLPSSRFCSIAALLVQLARAQTPTPSPRSVISQSLTPPAFPQKRVDEALIEFPLAPGQERFRSIDGKKMHTYVVKLAEIAASTATR